MKTQGTMILIVLIGTICIDMVFTHEPGRGHHGHHRPRGGGGGPHHRRPTGEPPSRHPSGSPPSARPSRPSGHPIGRGAEISRCLLEDASSILTARLSAKAGKDNFVVYFAGCQRNGSFKCHQKWPAVGLSWQSDPQGRVMENTLTRGKSQCSHERDFRLAVVCTRGSRMLRCKRGTILSFVDIKTTHVHTPDHKCSRYRRNHGNATVARDRHCNVTNMIEELRSRCQGRQECWIKLNKRLIGKACTREVTFLRVNYTCEQRTSDLVENSERRGHPTYSDHLDELCPETYDEESGEEISDDDISDDGDDNTHYDYDDDDGWSDNDDEDYRRGYDEDAHDILDDEMAHMKGLLFTLFEQKRGKDRRPRYNWIKQPDLYNEFKFNPPSVCSENRPLLSNCNQNLCKNVKCDNERNFSCRVNPCGTCRPECYNVKGHKVQTPRALTRCEYQRIEMRRHSLYSHVPRCNQNGSFAEIQCYHEVKKCWCVDEEGRERNGTRQSGAPSNCSAGGQVLSPCQTAQLNIKDLREQFRVISERYERTAKTLKLRAQNATLWRQRNNESLRLVWQRAKICRKLARITHLHAMNTNVPTCAADGSYDSKQCASSRKFCRCVDESGRPTGKMQIKRYEELNCSKTAADHEKLWTCSSLLRSGQKTRRICRKNADCFDSEGMCCRSGRSKKSRRSRKGNKVCFDPPPKMPENKPGMCPVMPTSVTYSCKSQCETDANCEGENRCCMMGCGKMCVPPNEPVCPKDKPFKLCIYDKCLSSPGCFNHPSAYCRMNYCGGCTAEYFDNYNRKVDCINEGKKGQNELRVARVSLKLMGDFDEVAGNKENFIRYTKDEIVKKSNHKIRKKQIRNIKLERGSIKVTFEIAEESDSATLDEIVETLESHIRSKNFVVKMLDKEYRSDGTFHASLHVYYDDDPTESKPKRLLTMTDAAIIGAFSGIILFGAVLFVRNLYLRWKKKEPEIWRDKIEQKLPGVQYVIEGPEPVMDLPPKTNPELETELPDPQDYA